MGLDSATKADGGGRRSRRGCVNGCEGLGDWVRCGSSVDRLDEVLCVEVERRLGKEEGLGVGGGGSVEGRDRRGSER